MIKDNEFEKIKGVPGPTKEEIRSIILYKSNVKSSDIVVDIGCGTGGISTEFSLHAKKVYSIDVKEDAMNVCRNNISKLGDISLVDEKLNPTGRVIVPSILLDTCVEAVNIFKSLDYSVELVNVNVSEAKILDRGIMMFAKNPISIVSAVK